MMYEVMSYCRNFFIDRKNINEGTFTIVDGALELSTMLTGQYFLIKGSVLNDGVYKYPSTDLVDEEFEGMVIGLKVPKAFIDLCDEISIWQESNATPSKFQSESFGGYSYSMATNKDGNAFSWKDAFASRLNMFRKL